MNKFINYSFYTAFLIIFIGLILFIYKPCLLYFVVIFVGFSSIINHYHNNDKNNYTIDKWPLYRIFDWIMVIYLIYLFFINYNYYYNFYIFVILIFIFFTFIIWYNIFLLDNQDLIIMHATSHIFLIIFLIYFFLINYNFKVH